MRYGFLRGCAAVQTVIGVLLIVLGILGGLAAWFFPDTVVGKGASAPQSAAWAFLLIVGGLVVGIPMAVVGQLLMVFLEQRDLLEEIRDALLNVPTPAGRRH